MIKRRNFIHTMLLGLWLVFESKPTPKKPADPRAILKAHGFTNPQILGYPYYRDEADPITPELFSRVLSPHLPNER